MLYFAIAFATAGGLFWLFPALLCLGAGVVVVLPPAPPLPLVVLAVVVVGIVVGLAIVVEEVEEGWKIVTIPELGSV